MANYTGPTFLATDQYRAMQARRFDEMSAEADLPSEPIRVKVEQDRFDEMASQAPDLAQEHRAQQVQSEQARFDEMSGQTPLLTPDLADRLAPAPPLEQAAPPPEPAAPTPPVQSATPDAGLSGAPADDPVAKTLAFLQGLGDAPADQPKTTGALPALPEQSFGGTPIAAEPTESPASSIDPLTPDVPLPPTNVGLRTPFGPAMGTVGLPFGPAKPVEPTDETTRALAEGKLGADQLVGGGASSLAKMVSGEDPVDFSNPQAAIASIAKVVRALMDTGEAGRLIGKQGESLPGNVGGSMIDEGEAMTRARLGEEIGGTGGGLGGGIRMAGDVGGHGGGAFERAAPDSYAGGDLAAFMERKRLEAARRKNAGEVRGPGGADYTRAAEEAYYREKAAEPPLWQSDWAKGLEEPASYGARPPDDDWFDSAAFAMQEPEAAGVTRAEALAGMNRGDLLSALKRLNAQAKAGAPTAEAARAPEGQYRLPGGPTPSMPDGPTPEDVQQGRYQLPGVLGDGAPPPMPSGRMSGLRQRDMPGLGEDLGAIKTPQKVPWIRHAIGSQLDVIGAPQNGEFGKQLAGMVHDVRDHAATMRGAWIDDARDALALPAGKFANLVDVLEGKAAPLDESVRRAADATRLVFDEVYERARKVLPDVKAKIDDYFPHVFDPKEFEGQGYQRAVRHLIDTGQAKTVAEAGQLLGQARRFSSDFRKSGNLENAREVDLPGYLKTPDALVQHLTESSRRIAEAEMFGAKGELKDRVVAQIAQDGGDAAAVDRAFKTAMEQGEPPSDLARGATRGIRAVESAAHLGLSALSNATQLTNTAAVFGPRRTAANVKYAMSADGVREAVRAGVVDPATIANVKEGTGATRVLGTVTAPGMGRVETMNRSVTFHTAIDFATEMARKAPDGDARALRALEDLGLDAASIAERGTLTDAERVRAGRIGVERTQFYVDPQDLPGWASSPVGRVVSQFRTFGYQQSRYLGREILTPLVRDRNPIPLLTYLAVGTALGVPVDTAYDVASGRGVKDNPADIALGGLARAGGLGLAGDVYRGARNIGTLPPEMAVARTVGLVGGPFVSDAANAVGATAAAASSLRQKPGSQAHPFTPMMRTAFGLVPIAGPLLQNTFAPYKKRDEPSPYVLPGRSSGRDDGRSSGRRSGR